jgi:DNA repair exonuclease SbcCD ATPase subunit
MIINSISIRNFKSYGNNLQKLQFSKDGALILIKGKNGNGKSSLLESIDFSLFNIVRGKNSKRVPNYILPNRNNKNLETEINFINWNGDNITINRKLNPKSFKILVNDIDNTNKYDLMTQEQKDDLLGIEYNTYKSLVSLNLADFANFINLDTDTKKKLLNKLFNLDEVDNYLSITKELLKNIYKKKDAIETMIIANNNSIKTYNDNIQVILEKSGLLDKDKIKGIMLEYKNEYIPLNHEIKELRINYDSIINEIKIKSDILNIKRNKISEDQFTLNDINKKVEIFKNGSCPYCGSNLSDNHHTIELNKLIEDQNDLKKNMLDLKRSYNDLRIEISSKIDDKNKLNNDINEKSIRLKFLISNLKDLKDNYNKGTDSISINEINKNIEKLESDNIKYENNSNRILNKIYKYEKLIDILSEKGIRKNIIRSVVEPINEHLSKYLIELESKYSVKLDDSFDAIIKERFIDDIHIESLSTGEARKINIAIALSYMEMVISMNKKTNILFMDEVFSSVDPDNIDLMLKVLRSFSNRNKINVIIVNHTDFDNSKFDRVIQIDKIMGYSHMNYTSAKD